MRFCKTLNEHFETPASAGPLLLACRQADVLLRAALRARRPAKARGREVRRV